MQYLLLVLASIASTAVAQLATGCAAQNILDACKSTIQAQVDACAGNDVSCLCTQYGNLLTCYNNCPNDIGVNTVQTSYNQACSAASVQSASSESVSLAAASSASAASASEAAASQSLASVSATATSNSAYSGIPQASTTATEVATTTESTKETASATENAASPVRDIGKMVFVLLAGLGLLA